MTIMATESPFYRVSIKALIFDVKHKLLVVQDNKGNYEMPGGGWEHGESLETCITRELFEELQVRPISVGQVSFMYVGLHEKGYHKLCIAVPVTLGQEPFAPTADNLVAARHISQEEFMTLPFGPNEVAVRDCATKIWPAIKN